MITSRNLLIAAALIFSLAIIGALIIPKQVVKNTSVETVTTSDTVEKVATETDTTETATASSTDSTETDTSSTTLSEPKPPETTKPAVAKSGYTLAEVAKHVAPNDCWTVISGTVYNLSSFVRQHPGGERNIMKLCGKDGTAIFTAQHGGDGRPESMLASLAIGPLIAE